MWDIFVRDGVTIAFSSLAFLYNAKLDISV